MQPGNNYRAVASLIDAQGYTDVQTDNIASGTYLGAELSQNGGVIASEPLTVWRRLWVENDSMRAIPIEENFKRNDLFSVEKPPKTTSNPTLLSGPTTRFKNAMANDLSSFSVLQNGRFEVNSSSFPILSTSIEFSDSTSSLIIAGDQSGIPIGSVFHVYDDDDFGLADEQLPNVSIVNLQMELYFKYSHIKIVDSGDFNKSLLVDFSLNEDVSSNLLHIAATVVDDAIDLADSTSLWVCPLIAAYQGPRLEDNDPDPLSGLSEGHLMGETAQYGNSDYSTVFIEGCREQFEDQLRDAINDGDQVALAVIRQNYTDWIVAIAAHEMGHHPGNQSAVEDHDERGLMASSLEVATNNAVGARFTAETIVRFKKAKRWSK